MTKDYAGITDHNFTRHIIRLEVGEDGRPVRAPRYAQTLCGRYVDFTNSLYKPGQDGCPRCERAAGR